MRSGGWDRLQGTNEFTYCDRYNTNPIKRITPDRLLKASLLMWERIKSQHSGGVSRAAHKKLYFTAFVGTALVSNWADKNGNFLGPNKSENERTR